MAIKMDGLALAKKLKAQAREEAAQLRRRPGRASWKMRPGFKDSGRSLMPARFRGFTAPSR